MKLENDEEANSIFGPAISYSYCDVMDLKKYHKEPIGTLAFTVCVCVCVCVCLIDGCPSLLCATDFPAKVNTWIMANEKQSELLKLCIKAQNLKNVMLASAVN